MHYHAVERRVMAAASRRYNQKVTLESFKFWRHQDVVVAQEVFRRVILIGRRKEMWGWWRVYTREVGTSRLHMGTTLRRVKNQAAHRGFMTWRECAAQCAYERQLLRGAAMSLVTGGMTQGFRGWRSKATERAEQIHCMKAAVKKLVSRDLARGWYTLASHARAAMAKLDKQRQAFRRIINSAMFSCFVNWRSTCGTSRAQKDLCRRVARRFLNQGLALALYTWQDVCYQTNQQMGVVRNLLETMMAGAVGRAFGSWREVYCEICDKDQRLLSGTKRALQKEYQKMVRMFYAWQEETRMEGQVKELMSRVARAIINTGISRSFNTWREEYLEQKRAWGVMMRVARSIINLGMKKAWIQWSETATQMIHEYQVCMKAALGIVKGKLKAAWNKWRDVTQETLDGDSAVLAAQKMLRRMFMGKIFTVWHHWRETCAECRSQMDFCKRIMKRFMQQSLTGAWLVWKDGAAVKREQMVILASSLRVMFGSKMSVCFLLWRDSTKTEAERQGKCDVRAAAHLRWNFRACWQNWREAAYQLGSWQWSMAVGHWKVWASMGALMAWRSVHMQQQVSLGWWDMHSANRASWRDKIGLLKMFDGGIKHCKSREVEGAYRGWLASRRDGYERGLLEMWATVWCSVQKIRFGVTMWRQNAASRSEAEAISYCAHSYWMKKASLDHLTMWRANFGVNKGLSKIHRRISKRVRHWLRLSEMRAWRTWRQSSAVRKASTTLEASAGTKYLHRYYNKYFGSWRKMCRRSHAVKESLKRLEGGDEALFEGDEAWAKHKLNWGMEAARRNAPMGVGGLAYSSATLANHEREDWTDSMSRIYLGQNSPAAYRRQYLRRQ